MGKVFEHWDKPDTDQISHLRQWTKITGYGASSELCIRNGRLTTRSIRIEVGAARCDWHLDSGDHYAKVYVRNVQLISNNSSTAGVTVRHNTAGTSGNTFYCFEVTDGGHYYLWKRVNGVNTYWRSAVQLPAAARVFSEGWVELHIDGSTLRAYFRGVLVETFTDTSIPGSWAQQMAGVFGYNWSQVLSVDEFTADAIRTPVASGKLADLTDDFDGTELDPNKWWGRGWQPNTVVVADGQLSILQDSPYYNATTVRRDALDSPCHVAITPWSNVPGTREDALSLENNGDNKVEFIHSHTTLYVRAKDNTVTVAEATMTYDPVAHKYRRITLTAPNRYEDGYAYEAILETSPNGTTWTRQFTGTRILVTWNIRDVYVSLWTGYWATESAGPQWVRFDKLNISLQSLILAGSIRTTGWTRSFSVRERGGSINMAGQTDAIKVAYSLVTAALAVAGDAIRLSPKTPGGTIAVTGTRTRLPMLVEGGSIMPWAVYNLTMMRRLSSSVAIRSVRLTTYLGRVFGRAGIVAMRVRARGQVILRVRRPN